MLDPIAYLRGNDYPGRGILLGRSRDGKHAVTAYFILGRSENSRNRVFIETEDGIRTELFDPAKVEDPSLILYHPVRVFRGTTIITNGDQTDTIRDAIQNGHGYRHALMRRTFEPDAPHYTPRISGILLPDGSYKLSILKTQDGDPSGACRFFFEYDVPRAGVGHLIHTYAGNGDVLPSFEGEPRAVSLPWGSASELAGDLWNALDAENRISLFVRFLDLAGGKADTVIVNRHEEDRL